MQGKEIETSRQDLKNPECCLAFYTWH